MAETTDSFDDLWQFAEFCALEAFLFRSFLEAVRLSSATPEDKTKRIGAWKQEIGLQLGNPVAVEQAQFAIQTARGLPPKERRQEIQQALARARAVYFGQSA